MASAGRLRLTIAFAVMALPGAAQAISVAEWQAKADALKTMGFKAMFSPDIGLLKGEVNGGIAAWQAQLTPVGRAPNACPPAGGKVDVGQKDVTAIFQAVPPPRRASTSVRDAMIAGLNRKYACRG